MTHLPRIAATAIALAAGGLCAAWMIHGITATEADTPARAVRIAAGVFLLIVELAALWLAARLPAQDRWQRRALLSLAAAIALLDIGQMALAQISLHQQTANRHHARQQHARQLADSIERSAQTIAALRHSAANQADSKFPASRADGAASLRRADEIEQRLASERTQLAALQQHHAADPAPIANLIGQTGVVALSITLATLVAAAAALAAHLAGHLAGHLGRPINTPAARRTKAEPPGKNPSKPRSTVEKTKKRPQRYPPGVVELNHRRRASPKPAQGELFEQTG